jgi:hypothetical protein
MAYPLQINDLSYKSCSNDEYDALESNVPYTCKNNAYSPKSKIMYNKFNNCDIFAFISIIVIVLLFMMGIQLYATQNSMENNDYQPASIYTNYNEMLEYYHDKNHDMFEISNDNHHF